jgi:hypothetical protein
MVVKALQSDRRVSLRSEMQSAAILEGELRPLWRKCQGHFFCQTWFPPLTNFENDKIARPTWPPPRSVGKAMKRIVLD